MFKSSLLKEKDLGLKPVLNRNAILWKKPEGSRLDEQEVMRPVVMFVTKSSS